jgi:hypothetical protein
VTRWEFWVGGWRGVDFAVWVEELWRR